VVSSSKGSVSTAGGTGSIPGQGTNIPHTMWCGQKKKKGSSYTMPIKLYNSIVFFFFSIFTELFNHHHNQFQNILVNTCYDLFSHPSRYRVVAHYLFDWYLLLIVAFSHIHFSTVCSSITPHCSYFLCVMS